jgi:hypothetical protein
MRVLVGRYATARRAKAEAKRISDQKSAAKALYIRLQKRDPHQRDGGLNFILKGGLSYLL